MKGVTVAVVVIPAVELEGVTEAMDGVIEAVVDGLAHLTGPAGLRTSGPFSAF